MIQPRFADKVVLVTGGSSGLGAVACEQFAAEGARIFITDVVERDILARLPQGQAIFQKCDVSKPEDCQNAISACVEHYGRLDILFHNGARLAGVSTVVDHEISLFQEVINTNLCGLFYLAKAAIPHMRKNGKGSIVSTASTAGLSGDFGLCSYSAAKAGLVNLSRTMALDHAREGIRVNTVCPGYMITPMTQPFRDNEAILQDLCEGIPMGRGSDPAEVARAVLFLASDDASYITGQALVVDGGWNAHSGGPNFLKYMGS